MFEDDSEDICTKFFSHVDRGLSEGLACADLGARTPIGVSRNNMFFTIIY